MPGLSATASFPLLVDSRSVQYGPFKAYDHYVAVLPELRVEAARGFGRLEPFVGIGAGYAINLQGQGFHGGITLHTATGLRFKVGERTFLTGTLLFRSVRPFACRTVDVLLGFERIGKRSR